MSSTVAMVLVVCLVVAAAWAPAVVRQSGRPVNAQWQMVHILYCTYTLTVTKKANSKKQFHRPKLQQSSRMKLKNIDRSDRLVFALTHHQKNYTQKVLLLLSLKEV